MRPQQTMREQAGPARCPGHPCTNDSPQDSRVFLGTITAVTLAAFVYALPGAPADSGAARPITFAFMTLALAQLFHLGNARSRSAVLGRQTATANRWALAAVALVLVLQLAAVYIPPLARLLRLVPLGPADWLIIVPLALLPAIVGQLLKLRRKA